MRLILMSFGLVFTGVLSTGFFLLAQEGPNRSLTAPTYYISVESRLENETLVRFHGLSNLPAGSVITITVRDFHGEGWDFYSDEMHSSVNDKGQFDGKLAPQQGKTFRRNFILVADFMPYHPDQPSSVLKIVGKKGEFLGGPENPQRFQVSGWMYGLEAIARTL